MTVSEWIAYVDQRVWGPGMLVLLMGTGVFLTPVSYTHLRPTRH